MGSLRRTTEAGCVTCAQRICNRVHKAFYIVRLDIIFIKNDSDYFAGPICRFDVCSACQARAASAPPGAAFNPPPAVHQHLHFDLNQVK
jgi:hypothetical protein